MTAYRLLFHDLALRLRWRLPVLVAWTALVGLGESVAVALLLPLLGKVGIATVNGQGLASELFDRVLSFLGVTGPVGILAIIVGVSAVQTTLFITWNWWAVTLARRYQRELQIDMFRAFMRARWSFIVERKAGELTNAIVTESERLGIAFTLCLSLLAGAVITAVYIVLSLMIAWQVTLSLIAFAGAAALAMAWLYRKSYVVGQSLAPLNSQLQSMLEEYFAGAKFIKAIAGDERAAVLVEALAGRLEKANAFAAALPGVVRSLLEFIALVGLAVMLVLGSRGMGLAAGNVVVVLALFGRLFPRITTMQANLHYLNGHLPAIEVIDRLRTAAQAEAERQDHSTAALKIDLPSTLTVRNLCVEFGRQTALDSITLALPVPGVLAVVGKSGAGKSTLVHTLLGLVEPRSGSISLGPYELATAPLRGWRRAIGYVPQETILFHASVRENLTLAKVEASDAEIELAAQRAHADEFIRALPSGYETIIGDQGVKLSGGQRQRLGIARALLTNPILLLMDEAMSALDAQSEAELLRTIEELRQRMGILIVSHRLASVRSADAIAVIENGRIVEMGTWSELMARRKRLYALAEAQSLANDLPLAVSS